MSLAEQQKSLVGSVSELLASQVTGHAVQPVQRHETQTVAAGTGGGVGVGVCVLGAGSRGVVVSQVSKRSSQTSHVVGQHRLKDSAHTYMLQCSELCGRRA